MFGDSNLIPGQLRDQYLKEDEQFREERERLDKLIQQQKSPKSPKPPFDVNKLLSETRGPETKKMLDNAPQVMAELTKQTIENPDVRVRERIRAEMKGLLNLVLADTIYPQQPDSGKRVSPEDPAGNIL